MSYLDNLKTITGVGAPVIKDALNKRYPDEAYKPITLSGGRIGADVEFEWVRQRVENIFGPAGIGWRLVADPVVGRAEIHSEQREKFDRKTGELVEVQTWHFADLYNYRFEFCLMLGDTPIWHTACTVSDSDDNMDRGYAARGAWTSCLKQSIRVLGGFDHIYAGEVDALVRGKKNASGGGQTRQRKPKDDGATQPPDQETAADPDSFKTRQTVSEFIKAWNKKGVKPPKLLEILNVKALTELPSRKAADEQVQAWVTAHPVEGQAA